MPSKKRQPMYRRRPGAAALTIWTVALLAVVLLAVTPRPAAAKKGRGLVSGTVTSKSEGVPLAGVEVTLDDPEGVQAAAATTDKRGRFSLEVPAGEYVIAFAGEGYARFETRLPVAEGQGQVITIELLDAEAGRRSAAAQEFNAGLAALEAGDRAAARERLLAAAELDPTLPDPHRVLAGVYLDEGAWADAARSAETFLAARPGDRQAQLAAYEAYRKLDDGAKVVAMRGALGADPELAGKLAVQAFNEGALAEQRGDAETAAARFEEALGLDAGLAAAHFGLATVQHRAGRRDEALATLAGGLALEPDSVQGRRLGFVIHDAGDDRQAAAAALDAYAEVDPDGAAEILFKRAEADFKAGDAEAARRGFERLLEVAPEHAGAHHLLGLAYLTSDAEAARRHLRRFLELAPADPEAEAVREILASLD